MRTSALSILFLAAGLTACASTTSGTTGTGTTGATTGGATTSGSIAGSTSGTGSCSSHPPCSSQADCDGCGPGYACSMYTFSCCGSYGNDCSDGTDCCSGYCDLDTQLCGELPGSTTGTVGTTTSSSSGTTGSGTTTTGTSSNGTTGSTGVTATSGSTATGSTGTTSGGTTGTTSSTSGGASSTLAFTWIFGASQTCEQAGVAWVSLTFNSGTPIVAPCRDLDGVEGVSIDASGFVDSEASYTVTAYDGVLDSQLGQVSGMVFVPLVGATPVPVTIPFASGQTSSLNLDWTFNGLTSTQAGITSIQVQVTDPKNALQDVNETLDGGLNGVSLPGFGPGVYPIALTATGTATYQASGTLTSNGVTPAVLLADLPVSPSGATGNVVINFSFSGQGCAAAGLDAVSLQLAKANGAPLDTAVALPCADAGTSFAFTGLAAPSTAFLWLEGLSQGKAQQLANPQIVVSAGATANYTVIAEPSP